MKKFLYFAAMGILILFLAGCIIATSTLNLKYVPSAERGPLSRIEATKFAVNVLDARAEKILGWKKSGLGTKGGKIISAVSVEEVIKDAIEAELRYNGHEIVNPSEAAYVFNVGIEQFTDETHAGAAYFTIAGTAVLRIALEKTRAGKAVYSRTYIGNYEAREMISTSGHEEVMNQTLAKVIQEFRRDPKFAEAIKGQQ